jgi:hypothetical protein
MKKEGFGKFVSIWLVFGFFMLNIFSLNLLLIPPTADAANIQPNNAFIDDHKGGYSEQHNERYGQNLTYIDDFNNDNLVDLVIGSPWYDSSTVTDIGAVFVYYGKSGDLFEDLNQSSADLIVLGEIDGDKFGWSVADAGDVNGDGINDLLVGAPDAMTKRGKAYIIYGGENQVGTYNVQNLKTRVLTGNSLEIPEQGGYGSSVAGLGDLNNDGYDDVLVGAPGSDQAIITFGYKNKKTIHPDLWDDDPGSEGVVTFDYGVNNTISDANTWGINGSDDGWDWIDSFDDPTGLYGFTTPAPHDHANVYAPGEPDGPDAQGLTLANRTALEVMVGRNHTHLNPYGDGWDWDPAASAAWGIEFQITNDMYKYIGSNSTISLGFDYEAYDSSRIYNNSNLSRRFIYTIRSRIWNNDGIYYLGDDIVNGETYVFYKQDNWNVPAWGPEYGNFEWDITNYITGPGSYYWDFGCYFDRAWSSRYDDGITAFFDNITMSISNDRHVKIEGAQGSGFGTSLIGTGDVNNDNYPDMLIGAPNTMCGYVALINGEERFENIQESSQATILLTGEEPGDKFGYSISNAGDANNDGLTDYIIGAPGGNYAHLFYSSTLDSGILIPDLWEVEDDSATPMIEFDSGLETTGNTPGHSGPDDGWDVWNGVYGYQSGGTPGSSVKYNGADGTDPDQVKIDQELIIAIGGFYGGGSSNGAKPDSGAYGVKFSLSKAMADALTDGATAVLSYDWYFENLGLDQDETIWIKTYIRDNSNNYDLGWDLDKYAGVSENKDDSNEVHWADNPYSTRNTFIQDCSFAFSGSGLYYLDLGAKVRDFWWENSAWEDGIFHFDNVYLRINPAPDVRLSGPMNSSFGYSISISNKLDMDEYSDVIIGAPSYNSPNGENSGAVFGFILGPESGRYRSSDSAEFIRYGENPGDNFGWSVLGTLSLDSDEFTEIITTAPKFDSSAVDAGKIYQLSISKGPRIRILSPVNFEVLSGEIKLNATVIDPDNNIDTSLGVFYYYSNDGSDWELIGNVLTPTYNHHNYEIIWNTSSLPDGNNYRIKAWVQDLLLNKGENISADLTIDNPHNPYSEFKSPKDGEVVSGTVELKALVGDSPLDLLGGGINETVGVTFYFSKNNIDWEIIQNINSGSENKYVTTFDTTIYPDGEYWLKVTAVDLDGYLLEQSISINIDNPPRRSSIELLQPLNVTELSGTINLKATAYDFDGDINSSGISFYISKDVDSNSWTWSLICNDPEPEMNSIGIPLYSCQWDTTTIEDGWYSLKAVVNDTEGLSNESIITTFAIHNKQDNAPQIQLVSPVAGKVVEVTEIITAYVRDLDNDLSTKGVDYYYSSDLIHWRHLGSTTEPRFGTTEYFDFLWATDIIPDGNYWLNVSVSDEAGNRVWDISDEPVLVHNSDTNTPVLTILAPKCKEHINGTYVINVQAIDLENNINNIGVRLFYSTDGTDWTVISNTNTPTKANKNIYELGWDTTQNPDGIYWLKAEATDFTNLKGVDIIDCFYIHNNLDNPPKVVIFQPDDLEISGTVKLNATVFDLEKNVNSDGVKFYYSTDNKSWHQIGNDPTGKSTDVLTDYFEINWDTTQVNDGTYWVRAVVEDETSKVGMDFYNREVIVHNNQDNPPKITLKQPRLDVPLIKIQQIVVDIFDFEDDVESVLFFYSTDNESWQVIDTVNQPSKNNVYMTRWDTGEVNNGEYYLKIVAIDKYGNQEQLTVGPVEVTMGKEVKEDPKEELPYWLIMVIICVVIIVIVILSLLRRSKHREEELIEEVSAEMRKKMNIQDEEFLQQISNNDQTDTPTPLPKENNESENLDYAVSQPEQEIITTVEPDVETLEFYRNQVQSWKEEGYDVSQLELLGTTDEIAFAIEFPIYSSNISRLKNIALKLSTLDTVGYESQIESIKSKLSKPDNAEIAENEYNNLESKQCFTQSPNPSQIPQKEMGTLPKLPNPNPNIPQVAPEQDLVFQNSPDPVQPMEAPNDYEVPPELDYDVDLPSNEPVDTAVQEPELLESPFAHVETQSLEEELNGKAPVIELPKDEN